MLKLLDFESFINESNMIGGPGPKFIPIPTSNPRLIAYIGSPEQDIQDDKFYISTSLDDIKIMRSFKSPVKLVSVNFNGDDNSVREKGLDIKGGIYINTLNPLNPLPEPHVFICKNNSQCSSLAYEVLGNIIFGLETKQDYSLISDIVKTFDTISKHNDARTALSKNTSFKSFLMGLRNITQLSEVKASLGQLSSLDKGSLDPQALLVAVRKGLGLS